MDRLDTMELFVSVVETGSFSEAGRRLGHAPSAVTRRIDDLERWIGAALFYRSTRRLTLTEVGQAFLGRARQLLLDIEEARVVSAGLEEHPSGTIRLSAGSSLGPQVTSAICDFQERWPQVSIAASITDRMTDLVAEGLDIAIRTGRLSDSPLKALLIGRAERLVCAGPGYLEKHGRPRTPEDLAGHNCLTFRTGPGHNVWHFRGGGRAVGVRASGGFFCDDGRLLVHAARQNKGIVLAPRWLLGADLKAGGLVPLLPRYRPDPPDTPVHALHPYTRFVPPKVRTFVDFLVDRFRRERDWATDP